MGLMSKILKQCRKPSGLFGRMVARGMNASHSKLVNWGLRHITIRQDMIILDVGCGGGGTVSKLAQIATKGKVYGIDYSEASIRISRKTNQDMITKGRVKIQHGSVSNLPYNENMFDLVTAVETHYFWPDLTTDLKEVMRVQKPGGLLIVLGGEYKGGKYDERNEKWVALGNMSYHTPQELRKLFLDVGFTEVEVHEEYEEGWICVIGKKPI